MLERFQPVPPDPILGLGQLFAADTRDSKIDLGVGVFKDASGNTPIMSAVKKAEKILHESQTTKTYKGLGGDEPFRDSMRQLVLGDSVPADRVATIQTPGGTGAIRQLYEVMKKINSGATLWLSDPTWPSHVGIAKHMGLTIRTYRYFDSATSGVDFDAMMQDLAEVKPQDILMLHGCCHNPTGANLDASQWDAVTDLVLASGAVPFVDIAYQGFGDGLDEDASGLRAMAARFQRCWSRRPARRIWPLSRPRGMRHGDLRQRRAARGCQPQPCRAQPPQLLLRARSRCRACRDHPE